MITIPFSLLPDTSQLFDDYCQGVPSARHFFLGHFSDLMAFETHLQVLESRTYLYNRPELCDALDRQNRRWGSGEKSLRNIDLLRDERTFAVVTGQQVGLFTGPLYTLYKAITAVRHAEWLRGHFPSYDFVPVFWMETEDHDLQEANSAGIIDRENNFRRLQYPSPVPEGERNVAPVGGIAFTGAIRELLGQFGSEVTPSDFTADVIRMAGDAYREGETFGSSFARMMAALLPEEGLILLDPSDPAVKKLYGPVIHRELETFPAAGEEVIQRSAELEEKYHAQIKPRAVNLFFHHKGGRYAIEPSEYGFFLRGTRQRFQRDELRALAASSPELFSVNVLLRPIAQDFILPTVSYVAGPGEVAYFAQLQPVYDHFELPMPVIFPRASLTLIEPKIQKLFDKFEIEFASMFKTPDELYRGIMKNNGAEGTAEIARLSADIDRWRTELAAAAERVDRNLVSAVDGMIEKMRSHLALFEQKLLQSARQRDQVIHRQLEKMQMYLNPEGKLQERQLNILTFLNRYGFDLIPRIAASCDAFPVEHRIVHIGG